MTSPRHPTAGFWITVALVALLVGYSAAYVLLMQPIWTIPHFGADWERYPIYRLHAPGDEAIRSLFGPIHWIDRKLRPEYWCERRPFRGGRQP